MPAGPRTLTHTTSGLTASIAPIPNSDATPGVSLHGGPSGFDQVDWEPLPLDAIAPSRSAIASGGVKEQDVPGVLFSEREIDTFQKVFPSGSSALFRYLSKGGDQGYPGDLLVEVVVGLLGPKKTSGEGEWGLGSVVFIYRAKVVGEGKGNIVTPVNLTQVRILLGCFE